MLPLTTSSSNTSPCLLSPSSAEPPPALFTHSGVSHIGHQLMLGLTSPGFPRPIHDSLCTDWITLWCSGFFPCVPPYKKQQLLQVRNCVLLIPLYSGPSTFPVHTANAQQVFTRLKRIPEFSGSLCGHGRAV